VDCFERGVHQNVRNQRRLGEEGLVPGKGSVALRKVMRICRRLRNRQQGCHVRNVQRAVEFSLNGEGEEGGKKGQKKIGILKKI